MGKGVGQTRNLIVLCWAFIAGIAASNSAFASVGALYHITTSVLYVGDTPYTTTNSSSYDTSYAHCDDVTGDCRGNRYGTGENRIPLIIVHGINNTHKTNQIQQLTDNLATDPTIRKYYQVFTFDYDYTHSIQKNGTTLARVINYVFGRRRFVMIGHSMGGLVARAALEKTSFSGYPLVKQAIRLITLGTPHHGTPAANPKWLSYRHSTIDLLSKLKIDPTAPGNLDMAWDNFDGRATAFDNFTSTPGDSRFLNQLNRSFSELNQYTSTRYILIGGYSWYWWSVANVVEYYLYGGYLIATMPDNHLFQGFWGHNDDAYSANDGIVPLTSSLYLTSSTDLAPDPQMVMEFSLWATKPVVPQNMESIDSRKPSVRAVKAVTSLHNEYPVNAEVDYYIWNELRSSDVLNQAGDVNDQGDIDTGGNSSGTTPIGNTETIPSRLPVTISVTSSAVSFAVARAPGDQPSPAVSFAVARPVNEISTSAVSFAVSRGTEVPSASVSFAIGRLQQIGVESLPVSFSIARTNHPPVATDHSFTTTQNTPTPISLAASDSDSDPLAFQVVTPPANGILSGTFPLLTYTPLADYVGSDVFTYKTNDGMADSNIGTVQIIVNDNLPPSLLNMQVTPRSIASGGGDVSLRIQATDASGVQEVTADVKDPSGASESVSLTSTDGLSFTGTFKASKNTQRDAKTNTVRFTAADTKGNVSSPVSEDSFTIAGNSAPVSSNGTITVDQDTSIEILLASKDADGDSLTYRIASPPTHGSLVTVVGDKVTYKPNAGYAGSDRFTFAVSDNVGEGNASSVTITVKDTAAPLIENPKVSPASILFTGGEVTVTATVTDNIGVASVQALFTHPNGERSPVKLTQKDGTASNGTWEGTFVAPLNSSADDLTYKVTISAKDAADNVGESVEVSLGVEGNVPFGGILTARNADGYAGGIAKVFLTVDDRLTDLSGLTLSLQFDPQLGLSKDDVQPGALLTSPALNLEGNVPGLTTLQITSPQGVKGPGDLASLSFHLSASAQPGSTYTVTLSDATATDSQGRPIKLDPVSGTILVVKVPGDVDGSNQLNVSDAVETLKQLVGLGSFTEEQEALADLNKDGSVDVLDVVIMLKRIVGIE